MITSFVIGWLLVVVAFLYSLVDRYRNLAWRIGETRADRVRRILGSVAWVRVTALTILGGVAGVVLWHGLDDVLDALVAILVLLEWYRDTSLWAWRRILDALLRILGGSA